MDLTIDFMGPDEADAAARVLGDAFVTNPNSVAIWRRQGDAERRKQAAIFRLLKLDRPYSKVLVARQGAPIVGVLNMAPWPRCQMSAIETAKQIPRLLLVARGAALRGTMGRAAKLQSIWARHDPDEAHWHLGPVGVSPPMQGQGIGGRLMSRFCELIDEDRLPAHLETDRPENVPFYERFGFRVTGETPIHGVDNWFMWREAR